MLSNFLDERSWGFGLAHAHGRQPCCSQWSKSLNRPLRTCVPACAPSIDGVWPTSASADHWSDPPCKAPMLIRSVADMCLVDHWSASSPWEKVPTACANQQCGNERVRGACPAAVDHWSNTLLYFTTLLIVLVHWFLLFNVGAVVLLYIWHVHV